MAFMSMVNGLDITLLKLYRHNLRLYERILLAAGSKLWPN